DLSPPNLNGGTEVVASGGMASGTTVGNGGLDLVASGGGGGGGGGRGGGGVGPGGRRLRGGRPPTLYRGGGQTERAVVSHPPNITDFGTSFGPITVTDGVLTSTVMLFRNCIAEQFTTPSDGHGGALIGTPPSTATSDLSPPHLISPHST